MPVNKTHIVYILQILIYLHVLAPCLIKMPYIKKKKKVHHHNVFFDKVRHNVLAWRISFLIGKLNKFIHTTFFTTNFIIVEVISVFTIVIFTSTTFSPLLTIDYFNDD